MQAHYEDEILLQYLEGRFHPPLRQEIETHLHTCTACTDVAGSYGLLIQTMRSTDVWDGGEFAERQPSPQMQQRLSDLTDRLRREDADAQKVTATLLVGPHAWWRTRFFQSNQIRTAGMVRELLRRIDVAYLEVPAQALEISAIAIEVADSLPVSEYPSDMVIALRAHAAREHGFALYFLGRFHEALESADRAEQLFRQTPFPEYDLARVALVRASIYRAFDRMDEALALTRQSAATFLRFGDRKRFSNAVQTEGAILFKMGAMSEAATAWSSLEGEAEVRGDSRGILLKNLAVCHNQLGNVTLAATYLTQALEIFTASGNEVEKVKARWGMAQLLASTSRQQEALPLLRDVQCQLERLGMEADAATAALEVAEILVTLNQPEEVPAICRALLDKFTQKGMTSRAVTALSFLREALAMGHATPELVRQVRVMVGNPARPTRYAAPSLL
jgi:tetratricopeptide (TPR) repeat protein